jgi:hypothetical protein
VLRRIVQRPHPGEIGKISLCARSMRRDSIKIRMDPRVVCVHGMAGELVNAHLSRYASISDPSTTLRIWHFTIFSISSQTDRLTPRSPCLPSIVAEAPGTSAGDGANQSSSSFSGPSNGGELENTPVVASIANIISVGVS